MKQKVINKTYTSLVILYKSRGPQFSTSELGILRFMGLGITFSIFRVGTLLSVFLVK